MTSVPAPSHSLPQISDQFASNTGWHHRARNYSPFGRSLVTNRFEINPTDDPHDIGAHFDGNALAKHARHDLRFGHARRVNSFFSHSTLRDALYLTSMALVALFLATLVVLG